MNNKRMRLLLVEDNPDERGRFNELANTVYKDRLVFESMTNSSVKGAHFVLDHNPDGVILDLELHKGEGSGLDFLRSIQHVMVFLLYL